jgi:preprotein translocase subunit SecE
MAKDEDKDEELDAEADEAEGEAADASSDDEGSSASEEAETAADEGTTAEDGEPAPARGEELAAAPADETAPTQLGATRYVHAAFFAAGILVAFLSGKILALVWHSLAGWGEATRRVPFLLRYAEEERESFMMMAGAVIGVIAVIQSYRKEQVRTWANEVAIELTKVTWPNREMVTNGTIVVVVASAIATVYVTLLDRFWGFLTNLVYGA